MRLGVDAKQADQIVRGSIVLPQRDRQVSACRSFSPRAIWPIRHVKAGGADEVGRRRASGQKIKDGWTDFDACIAAPDMMKSGGSARPRIGPPRD